MDATRFDGLTRSLATIGSRRRLLRRGAAGALTAALAELALGDGSAALECRGKGKPCRRDGQCCSGKCRNNKTCAAAGVGKPCNPNKPTDCQSGKCGCTKRDTSGKLVECTCRRAACSGQGDAGCAETADCCNGFCLKSRGFCFPPQQQCIPAGASCEEAPTLCCPGLDCTGGTCTA